MKALNTAMVTLTVALAGAGTLSADTVDVTKSNGDFVAGTGIPGDGFTVDNGANGEQVALKARGRPGTGFSGVPLAQIGTTYLVAPGEDVAGSGNSWWNFDFQFSPADSATGSENSPGSPDYSLVLEIDKDPAAGNADGVFDFTLDLPVITAAAGSGWDDDDGFFENPGSGAWNNDDVPYVYSQSWRMDFGFLGGQILGPGEYVFQLTAYDGTDVGARSRVARTSITAKVIPTPTAALAGLGLLGLFASSRRRGA